MKKIYRKILKGISNVYYICTRPFKVAWIKFKLYDLDHMQLYYFWPLSNYFDVKNDLISRLEKLKKL